MKMYKQISRFEKATRNFLQSGQIFSTAGGVISFIQVGSGGVTSTADWTNFSQEYGNYRILKMKIHFTPATVNATSITGPYQSMMMIGRYWGQGGTASALAQDVDTQFRSTLEEFSMENNHLGYPNASQWTAVGTSLPADRGFGMNFASPAATGAVALLAALSSIYNYALVYTVEFVDTY
jgi:hypothetical protein